MVRKNLLAGLVSDEADRQTAQSYTNQGAAKSLKTNMESLSEKALMVERGDVLLTLDPGVIDPSPFRDRLPDFDPQPFKDFKQSIADEGQKVPIQVRPHPSVPKRYQVIYGHRRLQAVTELGLQIKAIPIEISDAELVVAQGIENAARQDLSWIERALFAKTMEDAGVKPRHIKAALAINDNQLSMMRSVYQILPTDIIESIGRAPKVGRPRWTDLSKRFKQNPQAGQVLRKTFTVVKVLDSNERFEIALDALRGPRFSAKTTALDFQFKDIGSVKVIADTPLGEAFAGFLEIRLPDLVAEFRLLKGEFKKGES
ncbi:plasmid partitioning protein RepB [Rhizobium sp. TH2]|uniref:plasmid partitioning protein RepB n=1 Tax=Rhizobium sp. TH2 TaxID=2775403 RepID=UPI002157AD34|nr:plasmid partitioning protein RepB [Rhizobium sp. TH2]